MDDSSMTSASKIQYPAHRYHERYFALITVATAKVTLLAVF